MIETLTVIVFPLGTYSTRSGVEYVFIGLELIDDMDDDTIDDIDEVRMLCSDLVAGVLVVAAAALTAWLHDDDEDEVDNSDDDKTDEDDEVDGDLMRPDSEIADLLLLECNL